MRTGEPSLSILTSHEIMPKSGRRWCENRHMRTRHLPADADASNYLLGLGIGRLIW
jgi:hypothetical protein